MRLARTVAELATALVELRAEDRPIGLVPTMGAFHEGHLALMRTAQQSGDAVVVSLFVNPAQFGPGEDLARYPRDEERDASLHQEPQEAGELRVVEATSGALIWRANILSDNGAANVEWASMKKGVVCVAGACVTSSAPGARTAACPTRCGSG